MKAWESPPAIRRPVKNQSRVTVSTLLSKCTFVKKFVPVHSGVSNFEKKLKPLIKTLKKILPEAGPRWAGEL